jgi:hypothetical protein
MGSFRSFYHRNTDLAPINDERAARAWDTIRLHAEAQGETMENKPLEFWVYELLGDLRHLCDERGFDFRYLAAGVAEE